MRDFSFRTYFEDYPLSPEELSRGRALRVAGCVRSDEGTFEDGPVSHLWVVLSCAREGRRPARPRCVTFPDESGLRGAGLAQVTRLARHVLDVPGGRWVADEYAALVPDDRARILFLAGTLREAVGKSSRPGHLRFYGERIANAAVDPRYPEWLELSREQGLARPVPEPGPLMSIVTPAFRTPPRLLREMLGSVLAQTYPNWELVLVNASPDDADMRSVLDDLADPRVRVVDAPENLGIVGNTNLGISRCSGEYVSFLDHDDALEPNALAEMVREIVAKRGEVGLLYCDEDNIDERGAPSHPLIKPDLNPDFLLSNDYVLHWLTVRRDLLDVVGLSRDEVEGAQDYDLTLRLIASGAHVVHVPRVLYHWRVCEGSSAGDPASKEYAQEAGVRAIEGFLRLEGLSGVTRRGWAYFTYRTTFPVPDPAPSICAACDGGVRREMAEALEAYAARHRARVWHAPAGVRGSADLESLAVCGAELLLLVSPDHALDVESLELLVGQACQPGVFSAAPRVLRADGLLDYAGMVVRPDGSMGHLLRYLPQADGGYVGRAQRPYDALLVNPECCLVRASELSWLGLSGGFETPAYSLAEAFARAYARGLRSVFLPYATASLASPRSLLGDDPSPEEGRDAGRMLELFPWLAEGDPSHSPGFDPWSGYYRLSHS